MKQEPLEEDLKFPLIIENGMDYLNLTTKIFNNGAKWQQERSYSEEDMEIVEISSIDANYIPHYQTKEGQLLATKFNVEKFKKK